MKSFFYTKNKDKPHIENMMQGTDCFSVIFFGQPSHSDDFARNTVTLLEENTYKLKLQNTDISRNIILLVHNLIEENKRNYYLKTSFTFACCIKCSEFRDSPSSNFYLKIMP